MALNLEEQISMKFTREEWALITLAIAHYEAPSNARYVKMLDQMCSQIQIEAAPVGVCIRVIASGG